MWTAYILTVMFTVLFIINVMTFFGICYAKFDASQINKKERAIAISELTMGLTFEIAFTCLLVTISLYIGG